jgi:hypothetical protein
VIELNDEVLEQINSKVDCFYELILNKYDSELYREDFYEELTVKFSNPTDITTNDIEQALRWKFGKREDERLAPGHINVMEDIVSGWDSFVAQEILSPEESHSYWMNHLDRKTAYISVSYIVHLIHFQSHSLPIIDRFNWTATRYFLSLDNITLPKSPTKFSHIELLKEFIELLSNQDQSRSFRGIDKYLMMFGKHVAPR